jgi:hypothetical protein
LFLLGVLNSKACDFFLKSIASTKQNGYFEYKPMYLSKVPIPISNSNSINSSESRIKIIETVSQILFSKNQIAAATISNQLQQLQRAIDHAERRIDELVYELYGLTEEEVRMVEGG